MELVMDTNPTGKGGALSLLPDEVLVAHNTQYGLTQQPPPSERLPFVDTVTKPFYVPFDVSSDTANPLNFFASSRLSLIWLFHAGLGALKIKNLDGKPPYLLPFQVKACLRKTVHDLNDPHGAFTVSVRKMSAKSITSLMAKEPKLTALQKHMQTRSIKCGPFGDFFLLICSQKVVGPYMRDDTQDETTITGAKIRVAYNQRCISNFGK